MTPVDAHKADQPLIKLKENRKKYNHKEQCLYNQYKKINKET